MSNTKGGAKGGARDSARYDRYFDRMRRAMRRQDKRHEAWLRKYAREAAVQMAEIRALQVEYKKEVRETGRQMRESNAEVGRYIRETEREMKEFNAETKREMKEFDAKIRRQMKESSDKTDEKLRQTSVEMDKGIRRMERLDSYIGNSSRILEERFADALRDMDLRLAGIHFAGISVHTSLYHHRRPKQTKCEVDILLTNGEYLCAVEVKHIAHLNDIITMNERWVPNFLDVYDTYAYGKRVIIAVAAETFNDDAAERARELGYILMTPANDTICIDSASMRPIAVARTFGEGGGGARLTHL